MVSPLSILVAVSLALILSPVLAQSCTPTKIYDGGFLWDNWSWGGAAQNLTQQDNNHPYGGKPSVSWTGTNFGGIYWHLPSGTVSGFTYVHFYVNGLSAGGQDQQAFFYDTSGEIGSKIRIVDYTGGSMPTVWTEVKIPLSAFGLSGSSQIAGFAFQTLNSGTDNLLCYAAVTLECDLNGFTTLPPTTVVFNAMAPNGPYTVSGNKILDKDGNEHIFRGWARPSLEWNSEGACNGFIHQ